MSSAPSHDAYHGGLVAPLAKVWNRTLSFISSMSLKAALDLGIPAAIHRHAGPIPLDDLCAEVAVPAAKAGHLARLLRLLGDMDVVHITRDKAGRELYGPTSVSAQLVTRSAPFSLAVLHSAVALPWFRLGTWLRQGQSGGPDTPFEDHHGMSLWEYMGRELEFSGLFQEGMAHDSDTLTGELVAQCQEVFEGVRTVVDVGGGNGAVARAFVKAFPDVTFTVLDLPHVVAGQSLCERVEYVEGNMFEYIPPADAILLKCVLHDYDDEDCVKILKKSKEAIETNRDGKVMVADMVIDAEKYGIFRSLETQLYFDLLMMVLTGGKEREEHEWKKIFVEAGFMNYKITPVMGFVCLIELYG